MSMTQASAEYFERVAGEWDSLRTGYFGEAVRDAAIARAYLRPEMVVADVGSGTGFMAAGLAPLVAQVVAVDGSAAMLEVNRLNLGGLRNVEHRVADGAALPFEDASLDAVFANMYLHHCPDPQAAVAEMMRVLKPGGRLVITDLDQHAHAWMREEMADQWLGFDRAAVKGWLRAAGLVNVLVDATRQSCSSTSQSDPAAGPADISVFVATGSRRVSGATEAVQLNYGALATNGGCCGAAGAQSSWLLAVIECDGTDRGRTAGSRPVGYGIHCRADRPGAGGGSQPITGLREPDRAGFAAAGRDRPGHRQRRGDRCVLCRAARGRPGSGDRAGHDAGHDRAGAAIG